MSNSLQILVAEDEISLQYLMKMMLSDYNILIVENGKLLVEKAIELKPELILTDYMMPQMSGEDALLALRDIDETKNIPIVALTAKAQPSELESILAVGFNDCLAKPIRKQQLLDLVKKYIS